MKWKFGDIIEANPGEDGCRFRFVLLSPFAQSSENLWVMMAIVIKPCVLPRHLKANGCHSWVTGGTYIDKPDQMLIGTGDSISFYLPE